MNILNISFTFSIFLYSLFVIAAPSIKKDTAEKKFKEKVETTENQKYSQYDKMKTEQYNEELKKIHERTKSNNQHETPPEYITSSFTGLEHKEPEQLREEIAKSLPDDEKAMEAILHYAKKSREYETKRNPLPEEKSPNNKALPDRIDNPSSFTRNYQKTNPHRMVISVSDFLNILRFSFSNKKNIDLPITDIGESAEETEKNIHYKAGLKLSPKLRIYQNEDARLSKNNALPKKDLAEGGVTNSDDLTHLSLQIDIFEDSKNSNLTFAEDFWRNIEIEVLNQDDKNLGDNISDDFHTWLERKKQSYCLLNWLNIGYLLSNKENYLPSNTLLLGLSFYNIGDAEEERKYQKEKEEKRKEMEEKRLQNAMEQAIRYANLQNEHREGGIVNKDEEGVIVDEYKDKGTPWDPYTEKHHVNDQ
jgi:hypothetical protein